MSIINSLGGHVRKLAMAAAFALWGAAASGQNDLHYAKKPLTDFGLAIGSHAAIDIDSDGDLDMLTTSGGTLKMQINTPIDGIPSFGAIEANSLGINLTGLTSVAVADINNDGFPDIGLSKFLTNSYSTFWVFENSGQTPTSFDTPNNPINNLFANTPDCYYDCLFNGQFYFVDADSDGDTDITYQYTYIAYINPSGTMGGYQLTTFSENEFLENNGLPDSISFQQVPYPSLDHSRRYDLNGDGILDRIALNLAPQQPNNLWAGQAILSGQDTMLFVGLRSNIPWQAITFDVDGDGDIDIISTNQVLINTPNQPPTCQDVTVAFNVACSGVHTYQYYDYTISHTFVNDNDNACLADTSANIAHKIDKNALAANFTDPDSDAYEGTELLAVPSGTKFYLLFTESDDYNGWYGSNWGVGGLSNGSIIQNYYPNTEQFGILIPPTENTSYQFQVSDGLLWSDPCTYTILVDEASGIVYNDQNANGTQDIGEQPIAGYTLKSSLMGYIYTTNQAGEFNLYFSVVGDVITPFHPFQIASSPPNIIYGGGSQSINFGIQLQPNIADLSVDLVNTTVFRPGFNTALHLTAKNEGSISQNTTIELVLDTDITVTGSIPEPTSTSGDTLFWEIPEWPVFTMQSINISLNTPVGTPIGTSVIYQASIFGNINTSDANPENNQITLSKLVVGSYDPNDKACDFDEGVTTLEIADEKPFVYTIRFQNTGTYLADSVAIADTLDARFDITTFQVMSSSHPMTYIMTPEGVVTFLFDDIFLPPTSEDEPNSHGFVKYSLQTKEPLAFGDSIANTAYIYFDFNPPIVTNAAQTEVQFADTQILKGTTYHDSNDNGVHEIGEPILPNVPLYSSIFGETTYSDATGNINQATVPTDVITLNFAQYPLAEHTNPAQIIMPGQDITQDLGISFGQNTSDMAPILGSQPALSIGNTAELVLTVTNIGSIEQPSKVTLRYPAILGVSITENINNATSTDTTLVWETDPILSQNSQIYHVQPTYHIQIAVPMQPNLVGTAALIEAETTPLSLFDFETSNDKTNYLTVIGTPVDVKQPSITPIRLWPNPTDQIIHISLNETPAPIGGTVEVFDAIGRRVKTIAIKQKTITFDAKALPSGLYLCVVKDRNGKLVGTVNWLKID